MPLVLHRHGVYLGLEDARVRVIGPRTDEWNPSISPSWRRSEWTDTRSATRESVDGRHAVERYLEGNRTALPRALATDAPPRLNDRRPWWERRQSSAKRMSAMRTSSSGGSSTSRHAGRQLARDKDASGIIPEKSGHPRSKLEALVALTLVRVGPFFSLKSFPGQNTTASVTREAGILAGFDEHWAILLHDRAARPEHRHLVENAR